MTIGHNCQSDKFTYKRIIFHGGSGSGVRCLFDPCIRDPGWAKIRIRMNNPDHISKSIETFFSVRILKFFDADPRSGMEKIRIRVCRIRNTAFFICFFSGFRANTQNYCPMIESNYHWMKYQLEAGKEHLPVLDLQQASLRQTMVPHSRQMEGSFGTFWHTGHIRL